VSVRVEDGGVTKTVRSRTLQHIIRFLVEHQDRLPLDDYYAGELEVTWGQRGVTVRPRPVLPTMPNRPGT
jgi:hypothetical protein